MFGSSQKVAVRASIGGIAPLLGTLQSARGIPQGFWGDPFVLGFIGFLIGHFSKAATRGRIDGADLGLVLAEAFSSLSHMNGAAISRQYVAFAVETGSADFEKGADNAATIAFYQLGVLKNETDNKDVQAARLVAQKLASEEFNRGKSEREIVGALLLKKLFLDVVTERFDP